MVWRSIEPYSLPYSLCAGTIDLEAQSAQLLKKRTEGHSGFVSFCQVRCTTARGSLLPTTSNSTSSRSLRAASALTVRLNSGCPEESSCLSSSDSCRARAGLSGCHGGRNLKLAGVGIEGNTLSDR